MKKDETIESGNSNFTEEDSLRLLQLRTSQHITTTRKSQDSETTTRDNHLRTSLPSEFEMNAGRSSYKWQLEAMDAWKKAGRNGVLKVVTGAGKTVFALQAIEDAFHSDPDLRVSVVVPTIVLLHQWYQELVEYSNISMDLIGRHGGGHTDTFGDGKRLMIWVINSASRLLDGDVRKAGGGGGHFLVVDECHRSGSKEFRQIYQAPRSINLGLSATPEREYDGSIDDQDNSDNDADEDTSGSYEITDVIQEELGAVIYELTFARAVEEGIIPKFELVNYAVDLSTPERSRYDRISREIQDLEREIKHSREFLSVSRRGRGGNDFRVIRSLASGNRSPGIQAKAARYDRLVTDRKRLLYAARSRNDCLISVLEKELAEGSQIIVFHEVIERIDELFHDLSRRFPVVLYHSKLTDTIRDEALRLYWKGTARVILSARALIEGYNVPSTDVGIIAASSSSPRQRVQTIGRVLRRSPGKDSSKVYNIYVRESSDENIFSRYSWEDIVGSGAIEYHHWQSAGEIERLPGPPFTPKPTEQHVDISGLSDGDTYPGAYEGMEISVDTVGRVFRTTESGGHEYCTNTEIGQGVIQIKGSAGVFRVTPERSIVLVRTPDREGNWETYYGGVIDVPLEFVADRETYIEYRYSKRGGGTLTKVEGRTQYLDRNSESAMEIMSVLKTVPGQYGLDVPTKFYLSEDMKTVSVRDRSGQMISVLTLENPYQINPQVGVSGEDDA
jgi:superfamily II DNA or RNA helicase